jgi:hypothetical protein
MKNKKATMADESDSGKRTVTAPADPDSGSSLIPMLVGGLVMIVLGMIAVAIFS